MYREYRSQGQGPITLGVTSLDKLYNLPFMKNFRYRFLRNYESCKVEIKYAHGKYPDVLCIPEAGPMAYYFWSYIH